MDDLELDRRIRAVLETAQADAPVARRWHPPAPRRNHTAGFLAAAAAVVVFGLMGVALIRGLAGSESKDSASSGTTAGAASETSAGGGTETTSAAETTTGSVTESTSPLAPLPTYDVSACPTSDFIDPSPGTIVMSPLPVTADIETPAGGVCGGTRVLVRVSLTNAADSSVDFPGTFVLLGPGENPVGSVPATLLRPGVNTIDVEIDVPPQTPGEYDIYLDGYDGSGVLRIRG